MIVGVYGMMRSGTTLLCDLLTLPGRSLVFAEPMMLDGWSDERAREVHAVARGFDLPVGESPPESQDFPLISNYFDKVLIPSMNELAFWGYKEVHFHNWQSMMRRYPPDRLVLCVRDIRAVALSALDLVGGSLLAFPATRRLRDEAWLVSRLGHDFAELQRLRALPHLLVRYEDLVGDTATPAGLADYVGLDRLGEDALHRRATTDGRRRREIEKHGAGISGKSAGRHQREANPMARALADQVARDLAGYQEAFGYDAEDTGDPARPPLPRSAPTPATWSAVEDWRATGPAGFDPAFARRRARMMACSVIRPGSRILDLGCLLPVLKFMLPEGCDYGGVDETAGRRFVAAADWRRGVFPRHEAATHLTALGSFEFVDDVKGFLAALRATGKPILLTYHTAELTEGLDRGSFGWRNHLTRPELLAAFAGADFRATEQAGFDGYQSLYLLNPQGDQES